MGRRLGAGRAACLASPVLGLCLALAGACLQCHPAFHDKFHYYRRNVSWKTWWVGDREASQQLLRRWPQESLQGLRLTVSPEIPEDKLEEVAKQIFEKLDNVYKEFVYKQGAFPQILHSILDAQNELLQKAIVETRIDCENQCGVYEYVAVSCETCNITSTPCFGYYCKSTEEWETALRSLPEYITRKQLQMSSNTTGWTNSAGTATNRFVLWQPDSPSEQYELGQISEDSTDQHQP